ncbi:MAG: hypothetical protein ACLTYC_08360, partial [Ruminococcus callidus]
QADGVQSRQTLFVRYCLTEKEQKTGCQITDSRFFRMHCQIIGKGNTAFTSFPPFPKQLP